MKKIISFLLLVTTVPCLGVNIKGLDGRKGEYDPTLGVASLGDSKNRTIYSDVVEYNQAVTPPNIANPDLKAFATMENVISNPNSKIKDRRGGGGGWVVKTVTLYGIPHYSTTMGGKSVVTIEPEQNTQQKFEIYGSMGSYDPDARTAYLVDAQGKNRNYTDIVEYRQAVTPPNISNPKLKAFAKMPNPRYKQSDQQLAGGQFKMITLYGILKESDEAIIFE